MAANVVARIEDSSAGDLGRRFLAFVAATQKCFGAHSDERAISDRMLIQDFHRFTVNAAQVHLGWLGPQMGELRRIAGRLCDWREEHDLLGEVGVRYVENSYTRMVSWVLNPKAHPRLALVAQRAWFSSLGILKPFSKPAMPELWFQTRDGIPDLVMRFDDFVVVVEAKTGTQEHAAPSGLPQTEAYEPAVAATIGVNDETIEVVYLTPNRNVAANPRARRASFFGFAAAIAAGLAPRDVPANARVPIGLVLTHLVRASGDDLFEALEQLCKPIGSDAEDSTLGGRLSGLLTMIHLLGWSDR